MIREPDLDSNIDNRMGDDDNDESSYEYSGYDDSDKSGEDRQEYDLYDEGQRPLRRVRDKDEQQIEAIGDAFDIYDMVSRVHSPITEVSRDFTLGNLNSELYDNKLAKFIREQIKLLRVLESYLLIPDYVLKTRFPSTWKLISKQLMRDYKLASKMLMAEIDTMVISTRVDGSITNSMLTHGRSREDREELQEELMAKRGIGDKLFAKKG